MYIDDNLNNLFKQSQSVVNYELACFGIPSRWCNVTRIFTALSSCQVARQHLADIYIQFHIHIRIRWREEAALDAVRGRHYTELNKAADLTA